MRAQALRRLGRVGHACLGTAGVPEEELGGAAQEQSRGTPPAGRPELAERELRIGPHLLWAIPAHRRANDCDPGPDGSTAVGRCLVDRRAGGNVEPALCTRRPAAEGMHPGPEDRDRRMALELGRVLEPTEPGLDHGIVARRPRGQDASSDEPGEKVDVAGGMGVRDRGVRSAVRLAPGRRPPVEHGDELRLAPFELAAQDGAELTVVPIPEGPVELDEEQVRPLDRGELSRGVLGVENLVAERPAHGVENGRTREEPEVGRTQARQVLEVEVVDEELVDSSRSGLLSSRRRLFPGAEPRKLDACGPPLRSLGDLGQLSRAELDAEAAQEHVDLPPAQREVSRVDFREPSRQP